MDRITKSTQSVTVDKPQVQSAMRATWSQAWPLIRAQRRDAVTGLVVSLVVVGIGLYLPWPMKVIVDSILTDKAPLPGWLPADNVEPA